MEFDNGDEDIDLLIQDVIQASKLPAKARSTNIKLTVANLTSTAYNRGLLPDALNELIDLATTPSHLDQASLNAIVRNLYPATRISKNVVIRVVASLGHGRLKPNLNLQVALVRWLILVYHFLEAPAVLSQTYQILFSLLDTAALRPALSHLLALITRRKHVKPFRIQSLLQLSRQTGNDPCLVGLLRVFKDYYPEIIVGEAVRGKASAFKHPDPSWRARLDEIQEAYIKRTQDLVSGPRDGFRVNRPIGRARNKAIPQVHTSHVNENSVTLEEVENATSFVQSLDKLELPNQLVAVLADPLLRKLLLLRPSDEAYQRVANWLHGVLQDVIKGSTDEDTLWDILDVVKDFVTQTKTLPPVLLNFFAKFFELWDGSGRRAALFDILAYAPLHDFQELRQHIFQPFETAILNHDHDSHFALLTLYTNLLHHWITLLRGSDSIPPHASKAISELIQNVNTLIKTLAQSSPNVQTHSAILDFYEHGVRLVADEKFMPHIRIELPPSHIVYTLFFSDSLATSSRICCVLARYKKGFETAMTTKVRTLSYQRSYVNMYNGFLMDFCNCLWRSRAFSYTEDNSNGCMVPQSVIETLTEYISSVDKSFSLGAILGLSHSPTLCYQSIEMVRDLEDLAMSQGKSIRTRHGGPVTQASLTRLASSGGIDINWQDYRIGVLRGLTDKGLPGVAELLKCTMTVLRNALEEKAKPSQQLSQ